MWYKSHILKKKTQNYGIWAIDSAGLIAYPTFQFMSAFFLPPVQVAIAGYSSLVQAYLRSQGNLINEIYNYCKTSPKPLSDNHLANGFYKQFSYLEGIDDYTLSPYYVQRYFKCNYSDM